MEEGGGFRLSAECLDEPPNSRVFLVLGKDTGEALIRERFAPFGEIQDIWLVRDKRTHESRGIAFVKFARSSQACRAMEEMHGRSLAPDTKPIKVVSHSAHLWPLWRSLSTLLHCNQIHRKQLLPC